MEAGIVKGCDHLRSIIRASIADNPEFPVGPCRSEHTLDSVCQDQYKRDFVGEGLKWHHRNLERFDRWQSVVDALDESDNEPSVLFLTVPDTAYSTECYYNRGDKQYIQRSNQHLLTDAYCVGGANIGKMCFVDSECSDSTCERRFTYAVDAANAMRTVSREDCFTDQVHWSPECAAVVGEAVAEYLNGFNTCTLDAGAPTQRPQRYCRNAGGGWTTTTCTLETEETTCTGGATCQIRLCPSGEDDCPNASDTCNALS